MIIICDNRLLKYLQDSKVIYDLQSLSLSLPNEVKLTYVQLKQLLQHIACVNIEDYNNNMFAILFNLLLKAVSKFDPLKTNQLESLSVSIDDIFTLTPEQTEVRNFITSMAHSQLIKDEEDKTLYYNFKDSTFDFYSDFDNSNKFQSIANAIYTLLYSAIDDRVYKLLHKFIGPTKTIDDTTDDNSTDDNLMYRIMYDFIKSRNFNVKAFQDNPDKLAYMVDFIFYVSQYRPLRLSYPTNNLQNIHFVSSVNEERNYRDNNFKGKLYHVITNYFSLNVSESSDITSFSLVDAKAGNSNRKSAYQAIGECGVKEIIVKLLNEDFERGFDVSQVIKCEQYTSNGGKRKSTTQRNKLGNKKTVTKGTKSTSLPKQNVRKVAKTTKVAKTAKKTK